MCIYMCVCVYVCVCVCVCINIFVLHIIMYIHTHRLIYKKTPIPWNQMWKHKNSLRTTSPSPATSHLIPGLTKQQAGTSPGPPWAQQPINFWPIPPSTRKPTSSQNPLGPKARHAKTLCCQPVRWQPSPEAWPENQPDQKPALSTSIPQ